jgi:hypothetical protein
MSVVGGDREIVENFPLFFKGKFCEGLWGSIGVCWPLGIHVHYPGKILFILPEDGDVFKSNPTLWRIDDRHFHPW